MTAVCYLKHRISNEQIPIAMYRVRQVCFFTDDSIWEDLYLNVPWEGKRDPFGKSRGDQNYIVGVVYFELPPHKSLGTSVASFTFCYVRSTRCWIGSAMCSM